ncbi:MAG TPA: signal peptidase I [Phycisphaerae bacterium]|nr:signal peptidase I [Phycisphaerae bacterium]
MDSASENNPLLEQQPPVPTPVPEAPPQPPKPHHAGQSGISQVRDTLETVLLALILAFSFRTFCVEAFVIPTGSMAPTLDGAHFRVIDPKSGYQFDIDANVNFQWIPGEQFVVLKDGELNDPYAIASPDYIICPNDFYPIPAGQLPDPVVSRTYYPQDGSSQECYFPYAYNGDRVLVLKYLYWLNPPQRWDVVVFREPMMGQINFIKRLVGLPGETLEIVGGNVFINGKIARKPVDVEMATLQNVYNNDFYPTDAGQVRADGSVWNSPWTGVDDASFSGHWSTDSSTIRYNTTIGPEKGRLSFTNTDYLHNDTAYNQEPNPAPFIVTSLGRQNPYDREFVGDLCLHTVVNLLGQRNFAMNTSSLSSQVVAITLGQAANCFQVRLNGNGTVSLYRLNTDTQAFEPVPQKVILLDKTVQPLNLTQPIGITMSNIDREVRFWVNNDLVLDYQMPWTVDDAKAYVQNLQGNPDSQVPLIYLDVSDDCTLQHLMLFRDIYYTQTNIVGSSQPGTGTSNNPIILGPGQYFMLGDNTNLSDDSRAWNQVEPVLQSDLNLPMGVVPQRYVIGRAFMVYWPAGFRPAPGVNWPIVPDVGRMRLIR